MTVEEAQAELEIAVQETLADMGDDAPDEGSAAADIFASMSWDWPDDVAAEVARREFGFVPGGSRQSIADAFNAMGGGEW